MKTYTVTTGTRTFTVSLHDDGGISVNGEPFAVTLSQNGTDAPVLHVAASSYRLPVGRGDGVYHLLVEGLPLTVRVESERDRMLREWSGSAPEAQHRAEIHAPMPALVARLEVAEGDTVAAGQGVIILEAMKMENEIKTMRGGTVKKIHVAKGQAVDKGQLLILID